MKYASIPARPGWETAPRDRPLPRFYVWRDPRRCSPERLAELAAHDEHIRALDRPDPPGYGLTEANAARDIRRSALQEIYWRCREDGMSQVKAAEVTGVHVATVKRWEQEARKQRREAS